MLLGLVEQMDVRCVRQLVKSPTSIGANHRSILLCSEKYFFNYDLTILGFHKLLEDPPTRRHHSPFVQYMLVIPAFQIAKC